LEIKIPLGGSRFPVWKLKSSLEETIFQLGNQNPPQWKCSSDLEEGNHRSGNVPPNWRKEIIAVETFLQTGGRKLSWWKRSSNLEEENHRDFEAKLHQWQGKKALPPLNLEFVLLIGRQPSYGLSFGESQI